MYCLNSPLDEAVFGSTALAGCGGGHMTCLVAACFAASFHVVLWIVFSDHHLVNSYDDLCDTLRGEASVFAEPVEDYFILICHFIPFGTCS